MKILSENMSKSIMNSLKESENLTQAISIVAKEFKDRVIEEYKNSNDMSKELNDAIAFRLSELGVSSPEDWVGDVCYEILDMTPDGTPLATT